MDKLLIFAGTYEGRILCEQLCNTNLNITVSVATDYGKEILSHIKNITVHCERLTATQMQSLIKQNGFAMVVDCTHPYAFEVTENIKTACKNTDVRYIRLLREPEKTDNIITVPDMAAAVTYIKSTTGNVLVTTGSKELSDFCSIEDYQNRLYIRVLPSTAVIEKCKQLGYTDSHIIAMQGPFCEEMNVAFLKQYTCSYLLTKNTGDAGGLGEKLSAAQKCGVKAILIDRPTVETGYSINEVLEILKEHFSLKIPTAPNEKNEFFPLFVSSKDAQVLVIGGGKIATRRVLALLKFQFEITVLSPSISDELNRLSENNMIKYIDKKFQDTEISLQQYDYVIAATNDRAVNNQVGELAEKMSIHVNVVDKKEQCSFYFPAVITKGDTVIGVTCDGKSHSKTKHIASQIREIIHNEN